LTAALLAATAVGVACQGTRVENVLKLDAEEYHAALGLGFAGLEDALSPAADSAGLIPVRGEVTSLRSEYDPHGHHVGPRAPKEQPQCTVAPFGIGGPSNLLRSGQELTSSSGKYGMKSVSLFPAAPREISSSKYRMVNVFLKEAQSCVSQ